MEDKKHHSALWKHAFFERNNFYFGKLMTARDFTDEQGYLNGKRWLINRLGLGWGVLCGLKVRPHPHSKHKVVVEPGVAIDPFGHEIVVCREETVDLFSADKDCPPDSLPPDSHLYYVSIKYDECGVNPSQIPLDSCDGYKEECVYNRIREGYRFIVSREEPDLPHKDHSCETDCHRLLQDPSPAISDCPDRPECEPVPLASVCYNKTTATTVMDIDMSMANRKLAFSNEMLYELIQCLQEAGSSGGGQYDRRRHVPLLASTIKGLKFEDGRNTRLDEKDGFMAKYPFRLTSDGDYIWITDREDKQVWRINRRTNEVIKDSELYLDDYTWGIAYDGKKYMWITHHETFEGNDGPNYGKLTRVDVCTLKARTFRRMPMCDDLPECYRFPEHEGAPDRKWLTPYPGEVVLHDGNIYVAHDLPGDPPPGGTATVYELSLTRIDPVRGCIEEVIPIPVPKDDNRLYWSRIRAMASDGNALWVAFQASSGDRRYRRILVKRIRKQGNGKMEVDRTYRLENGKVPEHMAFDGTRLWISHEEGLSILDIKTGKEWKLESTNKLTALAYGGGDLIWAAKPGDHEASINWVNIFSRRFGEWLQIVQWDAETNVTFEISDMQFDGTYLYVAHHSKKGQDDRKGVIHRLLP